MGGSPEHAFCCFVSALQTTTRKAGSGGGEGPLLEFGEAELGQLLEGGAKDPHAAAVVAHHEARHFRVIARRHQGVDGVGVARREGLLGGPPPAAALPAVQVAREAARHQARRRAAGTLLPGGAVEVRGRRCTQKATSNQPQRALQPS